MNAEDTASEVTGILYRALEEVGKLDDMMETDLIDQRYPRLGAYQHLQYAIALVEEYMWIAGGGLNDQ